MRTFMCTFNVRVQVVFNVQQSWPQGKHALCFSFFFALSCLSVPICLKASSASPSCCLGND